jgi:soluble P-type ATPase
MIEINIPGSDILRFEHFVSDFSGTLSEDGIMLPGVREKLQVLSEKLQIHVLTSDTFGRAREELKNLNCIIQVLEGEGHAAQKANYVLSLGAEKVVAAGNGNNDAFMLRVAGLGIAVCLREGCSVRAVEASGILVRSPIDAIDLLLCPKRLVATLRI